MNLETDQIEELLRSLRPRPLSAEARSRMDEAVLQAREQGAWHQAIASARPSPLPPELAKRLEESLSRIPHPGSRKVVHFPGQHAQSAPPAWRRFAAAAAVALLGSVSALLIPGNPSAGPIAGTAPSPRPVLTQANAESLVPAGYRRGLREAKDEGIVWQPNHGPHRRLKLVYRELVTLRDSSGRTYQIERPRVEYVLVPAKVD